MKEPVKRIVKTNLRSIRIVRISNLIRHLNLIYKKVSLPFAITHPLANIGGKLQRVTLLQPFFVIQFNRQDVCRRNPFLLQKVTAKKRLKQIRFSATTDAGNDLDLAIPHPVY